MPAFSSRLREGFTLHLTSLCLPLSACRVVFVLSDDVFNSYHPGELLEVRVCILFTLGVSGDITR